MSSEYFVVSGNHNEAVRVRLVTLVTVRVPPPPSWATTSAVLRRARSCTHHRPGPRAQPAAGARDRSLAGYGCPCSRLAGSHSSLMASCHDDFFSIHFIKLAHFSESHFAQRTAPKDRFTQQTAPIAVVGTLVIQSRVIAASHRQSVTGLVQPWVAQNVTF